MNFRFKMEVTESDFLVFYKHHLKKTLLKPVSLAIYGIFFLFLLIGPIITKDYTMYIYLGFFMLVMIFVGTSIGRKGKKIYQTNKEAFMMTYSLDDAQIKFSTSQGEAIKLWSEFHSIYEIEGYMFIYLKNKRGLVFVKSKLPEEAQAFLINKAKQNMSPKNLHLLEK